MLMFIVWLFKSVATTVEDADSEEDDDISSFEFEHTGNDDEEDGDDDEDDDDEDDDVERNGWAIINLFESSSLVKFLSSVIFNLIKDDVSICWLFIIFKFSFKIFVLLFEIVDIFDVVIELGT